MSGGALQLEYYENSDENVTGWGVGGAVAIMYAITIIKFISYVIIMIVTVSIFVTGRSRKKC